MSTTPKEIKSELDRNVALADHKRSDDKHPLTIVRPNITIKAPLILTEHKQSDDKHPLTIVRPNITVKVPLILTEQADDKHLLTIVRPKPSISSSVTSSTARFSSTTPAYAFACSSQKLSFDYKVDYSEAKDAKIKAKHTAPIVKGRGKELVIEEAPWHPEPNERAFGDYQCTCGVCWSSASSWVNKTQSCKKCGNEVLPHKQRPLHHDDLYLISISDDSKLPNLTRRTEDKLPILVKKGNEIYLSVKAGHDSFAYVALSTSNLSDIVFGISTTFPFPEIDKAEIKLTKKDIDPKIAGRIYLAFGYKNDSGRPHMQELCAKCQELGRLCTLSMEKSSNEKHPDDMMIKGLPHNISEQLLLETFRSYGSILRIYLPELKPEFSKSTSRIAFITFQNPAAALQKFNKVDVFVDKPKYK